MSRRPPKPAPVRVFNASGYPLVYDSVGHLIDAYGTRDGDASDPVTAVYIRDRYLIVVEEK